ncbi:threonine/serine dehydratase [Acidipila sp. EB88]|uniref:threonine ammonia-lyase n=1 Tax=Acidipila sp. EB88 TaxID=2305226 RepID=UPI000F5D873B|nr:threonine/serine dehydratase [Acidipila sp. EB88]RRA50122.1 threonine/serine dehydratase [Acidipila sp. EB88]
MTEPSTPLHLVSLAELHQAQQRIQGTAVRTPLVAFAAEGVPAQVWLKDEGAQPIGSFKLRGAANKILSMTPEARAAGVITYSSGNHAQGVAYAAWVAGIKAVIVMPRNAPAVKRAATEALGAEIVFVETASSAVRKLRAEELAAEHGYVMVPPYDDPAIIAGQGTCGLEILEELPDVDLVLVPVSGGGLLSGIAAAIKQQRPEVSVIGVEPELAGDARESFLSGRLTEWPAELTTRTLADGLRTQSLGERNWQHIHAYVDNIVTVTEDEIRAAVRAIYRGAPGRADSDAAGLVAEPSGAVTMAALLFHTTALLPFRRAVAVLSGRNVEPALLEELVGGAAAG